MRLPQPPPTQLGQPTQLQPLHGEAGHGGPLGLHPPPPPPPSGYLEYESPMGEPGAALWMPLGGQMRSPGGLNGGMGPPMPRGGASSSSSSRYPRNPPQDVPLPNLSGLPAFSVPDEFAAEKPPQTEEEAAADEAATGDAAAVSAGSREQPPGGSADGRDDDDAPAAASGGADGARKEEQPPDAPLNAEDEASAQSKDAAAAEPKASLRVPTTVLSADAPAFVPGAPLVMDPSEVNEDELHRRRHEAMLRSSGGGGYHMSDGCYGPGGYGMGGVGGHWARGDRGGPPRGQPDDYWEGPDGYPGMRPGAGRRMEVGGKSGIRPGPGYRHPMESGPHWDHMAPPGGMKGGGKMWRRDGGYEDMSPHGYAGGAPPPPPPPAAARQVNGYSDGKGGKGGGCSGKVSASHGRSKGDPGKKGGGRGKYGQDHQPAYGYGHVYDYDDGYDYASDDDYEVGGCPASGSSYSAGGGKAGKGGKTKQTSPLPMNKKGGGMRGYPAEDWTDDGLGDLVEGEGPPRAEPSKGAGHSRRGERQGQQGGGGRAGNQAREWRPKARQGSADG